MGNLRNFDKQINKMENKVNIIILLFNKIPLFPNNVMPKIWCRISASIQQRLYRRQ